MGRLFRQAAILMAMLAVIADRASAELDASRFCIVQVEVPPGATSEVWRIADSMFAIPGLPGPIYTPSTLGTKWTIGDDRKLVPYTEPFPSSYLDRWVVEPWSRRVVAAAWGSGISVLNPGAARFTTIEPADAPFQFRFSGPFALPSRQQTMVVSNGLAFVVEKDRLRVWMSKDALARAGVDDIYSIHDAPSLGGLLVLTRDRRIFVLTGEQWHRVAALDDKDYGSVIDLPAISSAVFMANESVMAIRRTSSGGSDYTVRRLARKSRAAASLSFHRSEIFDQLFYYGQGGFFDRTYRWRRLTAEGLEDIPGGALGVSPLDTQRTGSITEARALRAMIIEADDGLHLYDGQYIRPIAGADPASIGRVWGVADLPSIGRTLVSAEKGLFEITRDGALAELRMPFPTVGLPNARLVDWQEAGVALAVTSEGLYVLNAQLEAVPIQGSKVAIAERIDPAGILPATGSKVLVGKDSFLLVVDTQRAGRKACDGAAP